MNTDGGAESGTVLSDLTSAMMIGGLPTLILVVVVIVVMVTKTLLKKHRHHAGVIGLNHEIAILAEVVMKTRQYLQTNCNGVLQWNDVSK